MTFCKFLRICALICIFLITFLSFPKLVVLKQDYFDTVNASTIDTIVVNNNENHVEVVHEEGIINSIDKQEYLYPNLDPVIDYNAQDKHANTQDEHVNKHTEHIEHIEHPEHIDEHNEPTNEHIEHIEHKDHKDEHINEPTNEHSEHSEHLEHPEHDEHKDEHINEHSEHPEHDEHKDEHKDEHIHETSQTKHHNKIANIHKCHHHHHDPIHDEHENEFISEDSNKFKDSELHPYLAIFLTTISALAATLGGFLVLFIGVPSSRLLGHLLSFSTGVMLYISYMDLMIHSQIELGGNGFFEANCFMFLGMILFLFITSLIPEPDTSFLYTSEEEESIKKDHEQESTTVCPDKVTPTESTTITDKVTPTDTTTCKETPVCPEESTCSESDSVESLKDIKKEQKLNARMLTTGLFTVIGISLHNLPEGLVVYNATVAGVCDMVMPTTFSISAWIPYLSQCLGRGLAVSLAIAMHNIPEGMAVALPIYYATKSKLEAFKWCFLSSLCEPLGAVIFGLFFQNYITHYVMAALNAMVAGIMIVLCVVELIPACLEHISPKEATVSNLFGQIFMFLTLYGLINVGAH